MRKEDIKIFEIRDRATYIVAMAIRMRASNEEELLMFNSIGYRSLSDPAILLISLGCPNFSARCSDEWHKERRSFSEAHAYIEKHFDELQDYQVIDVEHILGEKEKPSLNYFIEEKMEQLEALSKLKGENEK